MLVGLLMLLTGIIYLFIYLQSNLSLIYKWPILQDRVYYFALNVFNTTAGNKEANKNFKRMANISSTINNKPNSGTLF